MLAPVHFSKVITPPTTPAVALPGLNVVGHPGRDFVFYELFCLTTSHIGCLRVAIVC